MGWLAVRWRPRNSLQARLSRSIALAVTLMWLAATLVTTVSLRHEMDEVFDSALQEVAQRVLPLAYQEILNRDTPGLENRSAPVGEHEEYLTYIVRDAAGAVLTRSHDADPALFPVAPTEGFQSTDAMRFYTVSAVSRTIFVTAAEPLAHRREAIWQATRTLLEPLLMLIPLSLLGVWALVRWTLRPVVALRAGITARGKANLTPVDAIDLPEEIAPLAGAVNSLMARLQRALAAERSFTANSAHELRTPIAATLAQTQRLIAEMPAGALRDRADAIEAGLKQLAQLSSKLMQLAKAEGAGLLMDVPQDLTPVLAMTLRDLRSDPAVDRLLAVQMPETAVLSPVDPDAFSILARNLIENALKHGAADQPVIVSLDIKGRLSVTNSGPVVDAATLARLRQPFARGSTAAAGTGLGLAIAEAIAAGTGAVLDLVSPASNRADGFEAVVQLPVPASASPPDPTPRRARR